MMTLWYRPNIAGTVISVPTKCLEFNSFHETKSVMILISCYFQTLQDSSTIVFFKNGAVSITSMDANEEGPV